MLCIAAVHTIYRVYMDKSGETFHFRSYYSQIRCFFVMLDARALKCLSDLFGHFEFSMIYRKMLTLIKQQFSNRDTNNGVFPNIVFWAMSHNHLKLIENFIPFHGQMPFLWTISFEKDVWNQKWENNEKKHSKKYEKLDRKFRHQR